MFLFLFSTAMEEQKAFSLPEISLHSSKTDCWLIINGKVYDVTKFLEEHPGGDEVLIEASANGDATKAFDEANHSSTATSMMNSYCIGVVEGSESGNKAVKEVKLVATNTRMPSSSASINLFQYLIPLIIFGVAFAAWYFLNKASNS